MIDWDKEVLTPVMAVFGEDLLPTYMPRAGVPFLLPDAVFDSAYSQAVTTGEGSEGTITRPVLGVRLAHFPTPPRQNDKVAIPSAGKTFVVADVHADGHGHAKLMLMEAA